MNFFDTAAVCFCCQLKTKTERVDAMMKLGTAVLVGAALSASFGARADVLDFNTSAVGVSGNAVPLLSASNPASPGGFIDEMFTYKGFTFDYQALGGLVPSSHAWIWVTEGSTFAGLGATYISPPPGGPGLPGNGFIAHGCLDAACSPVSSTSWSISNATPFQMQSLDLSRFTGDTATINLYTNAADVAPARTIAVPAASFHYYAETIANPFATEFFSKITITGFKGYYGIDNINYTTAAPVPEASTYAMMLMGLGAVGFLARRRKSA